MGTWNNTDNAAGSVSWAVSQLNKKDTRAIANTLYANTTVGAFVGGVMVGQYGIGPAEISNTSSNLSKSAHAGWNLRTEGTGSAQLITITNAGSGYSNTDTLVFAAPGTGTTNATATIVTNGAGAITSATITNNGAGFVNTTAFATFANSTGGASAGLTANVNVSVGGRAGRLSHETLVAMRTIS